MAGYQKKTDKYSNPSIRNPYDESEFVSKVDFVGKEAITRFVKNIKKWEYVVAFFRWYPDLWFDYIQDPQSKFKLGADQRMILRCLARFKFTYDCLPRGFGKTLIFEMHLIHKAVFYPNSSLSLTAQTREKSAERLKEKYTIIVKHYPFIQNEIIGTPSFGKMNAFILFKNGSSIKELANNINAKGSSMQGGDIDEANLIDDQLFQEALEPTFNRPRMSSGGLYSPFESHGAINMGTTTGWKGSDAYNRCYQHYLGMLKGDGSFCIGADWRLALRFGRGETLASLQKKKRENGYTDFMQNYCSKWTGQSDMALVSAKDLMACRVLKEAELKKSNDFAEYVISVDVAQSQGSTIAQTVLVVLRVIRLSSGKIQKVRCVNMLSIESSVSYQNQAAIIKQYYRLYNAIAIVVDNNGLGKGVTQALCDEQLDPITGESLGCLGCMNEDYETAIRNSPRKVYAYLAQSNDGDALLAFIDYVSTGKLELLEKTNLAEFDASDDSDKNKKQHANYQTDFFIEETMNIRRKEQHGGKMGFESGVKRIPRDRFSAVLYGIWYISKFLDIQVKKSTVTSDEAMKLWAKYVGFKG